MRVFCLVVILTICAVLAGCGGGGGSKTTAPTSPTITTLAEAHQPAKWTVLVYLDADNDLEDSAISNFNQMERVGSTQDVHVVVQMDRKTGDGNGNWADTRRFVVTRDSDSRTMHSIRVDDPALGELDMGDAKTLKDFVQWGKAEFPADHYLLVVWDHGSGWYLRTMRAKRHYKTIAADDTSGTEMNVTDMAAALSGLKVDVVAFDACYMQQLEVAYELRSFADYMVGSATTEPSSGYDYTRVLNGMSGTTTPQQLCSVIVQQYGAQYPSPEREITQSAVDLSKIPALASATSDFASLLIPHAGTLASSLASCRTDCLDYSAGDDYDSRDLNEYAGRCASAVGPSADTALAALDSALSSAVICSMHNSDMPTAHGLAIYLPAPTAYDARYPETSLAQNTQWDEWLRAQQE